MLSFLLDNYIVQGSDGGSTTRADATTCPKALGSIRPVVFIETVNAFLNCWLPVSSDCECGNCKEKRVSECRRILLMVISYEQLIFTDALAAITSYDHSYNVA